MVDQRSSVDKIVPRHPLESLGCVYYNPVMWPNLKDPKLDELSPPTCLHVYPASVPTWSGEPGHSLAQRGATSQHGG